MVQAQHPNKFKCSFCEESFVSQVHLTEHTRKHNRGTNTFQNNGNQNLFYCRKCDFSTKDKTQLTKHLIEEHELNKRICYFWKQGRCNRMENCLFLHPETPRCRLQSQCHFWPNCRFIHDENSMCPLGVNCQNYHCTLKHPTDDACSRQNSCMDQYCQLIHYQVPETENNFLYNLALNPCSQSEFPQFERSVGKVWRPW